MKTYLDFVRLFDGLITKQEMAVSPEQIYHDKSYIQKNMRVGIELESAHIRGQCSGGITISKSVRRSKDDNISRLF